MDRGRIVAKWAEELRFSPVANMFSSLKQPVKLRYSPVLVAKQHGISAQNIIRNDR